MYILYLINYKMSPNIREALSDKKTWIMRVLWLLVFGPRKSLGAHHRYQKKNLNMSGIQNIFFVKLRYNKEIYLYNLQF